MIRIINLKDYALYRDEKLFRVDRSSPIGSPYYIRDKGSYSEKLLVCDMYEDYFNRMVNSDMTEAQLRMYFGRAVHRQAFVDYLEEIIEAAKKQRVALGCWCAPDICHAETIKAYIEKRLMETTGATERG